MQPLPCWPHGITARLCTRSKGMWDNTLLVFSSDNGGVVEGISTGRLSFSPPTLLVVDGAALR